MSKHDFDVDSYFQGYVEGSTEPHSGGTTELSGNAWMWILGILWVLGILGVIG